MERPLARRLKCSDFRVVDRFLHLLNEKLQAHNVPARSEKLRGSVQGSLTVEQMREYEKLDAIITKLCHQAEKYCRKVRAGKVSLSPAVDAAENLSIVGH